MRIVTGPEALRILVHGNSVKRGQIQPAPLRSFPVDISLSALHGPAHFLGKLIPLFIQLITHVAPVGRFQIYQWNKRKKRSHPIRLGYGDVYEVSTAGITDAFDADGQNVFSGEPLGMPISIIGRYVLQPGGAAERKQMEIDRMPDERIDEFLTPDR